MPAKFLRSFSEEKSDLDRQIGCMTGIFQIFDRHNLLGGKNFNGRRSKRIPSAIQSANDSKTGEENVIFSPKLVQEKISVKNLCENQRMSMESSRTSFSSSSCSSFSSVDCNKSTLQCPTFPDKSAKNSPNLKNLESKILDSMNKDSKILSVKTSCKEEFKPPALNYIDSPRPMHLSRSLNGSFLIGIDPNLKSPLDINESFRVLMKLKEAPWTFSESMEANETISNPRFSYDGREISTNLLDSREIIKSAVKLRDLPRLSLDSRESSIKISNTISKGLDRSNSYKERRISSPSVVAKLMGLESMPPLHANINESENLLKSFMIKTSIDSPKITQNTFIKHCVMNPVIVSKPAPIEPAPWKDKEKLNRYSNPQTETVYCEIEKRLKELEFSHANKDLRALKQILDAMQAKGLLESKKIDQKNPLKTVKTRSNLDLRRKTPLPASPIVIMKPAKYLYQFDSSTASIIGGSQLSGDCKTRGSPRTNRKIEENVQKNSPRMNRKIEENNNGSEKTSNSVSPRLQQRKKEAERRIRDSIASSDLIKNQNSSTITSPRTSIRNRSTTNKQGDISPRSDSNMALKPKSPTIGLKEEAFTTALASEQPSPISVLNSAFYEDDLPVSMVKRTTNSSKCNIKLSNSIDSEIIQKKKKLESIGALLQKLEELNSSARKTSSDHIFSLCEDQNPDHRYISEILLASGFLMKDFSIMPVSFHSPGYAINPNLYLVLEQTKSRQEISNKIASFRSNLYPDKTRRRLIFDAINEVLVHKLDPPCSISHPAIRTGFLSGQHLLKELCSEIDRLGANSSNPDGREEDDDDMIGEEIIRQDDHRGEIAGIALEIERSMFKEMIDDIVCGEALFSKIKYSRRRRQLFFSNSSE